MQENAKSTSKQGEKTVGQAVRILIFMLLLFVSIGFIVCSYTNLSSFYERKCEKLGQVCIEAVVSKDQETEKIQSFFEQTEYESLNKQEALSLEDTSVKLYETMDSNLLIRNPKDEIHFVKGTLGESNQVVVPYRLNSFYGMKLGDTISIQIGEENRQYRISGFYEDEIFSQQDFDETLAIYINSTDYEQLKTLQSMKENVIYSIQLKNPAKTNEVMEQLGQEMKEQLFIRGLDLHLYGGEEIKQDVNLYVSYAQKVCVSLGIVFALIGIAGSLLFAVRVIRESSFELKKTRMLLYCVEAGGGILGILVHIILIPRVFSDIIRSLGYGFEAHSFVLSILITCVIYFILMTLLCMVSIAWSKSSKKTNETAKPQGQSKHPVSWNESLILVLTSFFLAMPTIVVTEVSTNIIGHSDLFYQYDEEEDLVEVFHSDSKQEEEVGKFTELTDYVKPILQLVTIGGLIAIALIYVLVVSYVIKKILHRLLGMEEVNPKGEAISILGGILGASFFGFLLAVLVAPACMDAVLSYLQQSIGIQFDSMKMNYVLSLLLFGGFAVLASGTTVVEVN